MGLVSLVVIAIVSLVLLFAAASESSGSAGFFGGIFLSVIVALCVKADSPIEPIEVYQGKTELEYTIRGGEVVDSVVVYKKIDHGREN